MTTDGHLVVEVVCTAMRIVAGRQWGLVIRRWKLAAAAAAAAAEEEAEEVVV